MAKFRINCDMGENMRYDEDIMPYLDACSIACGGHVGDLDSMRKTVALAMENEVSIGAHPSFPDRENFGRKMMSMSSDDLVASLKQQIWALFDVCRDAGVKLDHVKPHGALYDLASTDHEAARAIISAMEDFRNVSILAPWKSVLSAKAREAGIQVRFEAFADRTYTHGLTLVSRDHPQAIIDDPQQAIRQVQDIFMKQKVQTLDGETLDLVAETFCVHGDNPAAKELVKTLHAVKNVK